MKQQERELYIQTVESPVSSYKSNLLNQSEVQDIQNSIISPLVTKNQSFTTSNIQSKSQDLFFRPNPDNLPEKILEYQYNRSRMLKEDFESNICRNFWKKEDENKILIQKVYDQQVFCYELQKKKGARHTTKQKVSPFVETFKNERKTEGNVLRQQFDNLSEDEEIKINNESKSEENKERHSVKLDKDSKAYINNLKQDKLKLMKMLIFMKQELDGMKGSSSPVQIIPEQEENITCPDPNCNSVLKILNKNAVFIVCVNCRKQFCKTCKKTPQLCTCRKKQ